MADFTTLVPDVMRLLDGKDISESAQAFADKLGAMVVDRFKRHGEERQPKLYLSNVGKPLRQLYYDLNNYKGISLSSETKFKFLYGSLLEELFLFMAVEAGHEVTDFQKRIEYDEVPGKIDAIIDGVLCDVKSCSSRSFEKFEKGTLYEEDPFGYIAQLTGYKKALGVKRAAFVAIDKVLGKICILELKEDSYDLSERIKIVNEMKDKKTPPPRCYEPKPISKTDKSGNLVLATGCSYCGHRIHCWSDSNEGQGLQTRFYSSGPKHFVKIIKEPRLKSNTEEFYEPFPSKE